MSLANGLSILFLFSKNQLLVLFAIVFFVSISFISALIFMISFLLLTLDFVCSSFSSSFRCKVRLFICSYSCFLNVGLYSYKLPSLELVLLHPIGFGSSCFYCHLSLGFFDFLFDFFSALLVI